MPGRKCRNPYTARINIWKSCSSLAEKRRFLKLAKSAISKVHEDFQNGVRPCCSIREKMNDFLDERIIGFGEKHCSKKTAILYRRRLEQFDRAFHSRPIDSIQTTEMVNWMKRRLESPRRGKNVSPDTVNADVGALKTFARWAQGKGFAPAALPLLTVPRLKSPGKMAGKNWVPPDVMDIDQLLDVFDAIKRLRHDIGLFFYGMLYFNLRPSEAANLRRGDLRLPKGDRDGTLKCFRIKTKMRQTFYIEPGSFAHAWALECLELSERMRGRPAADSPLIICMTGRSRRNPGGWMTDSLDKATARVCEKLGVKLSRPYIIRHSVISWLNNHPDVSSAAVTVHASHLRSTTTDIYKHHDQAQAKPAFAAIEKLIQSRETQTARG